MKITVLMENTACREIVKAEHGLSLYIETEAHRILFDAGSTPAFADNAEKLGVDLAAVELAVLSHGHYDHGGGLSRFLELNQHAPVYVSRHAFSEQLGAAGRYIGVDQSLKDHPRLIPVDDRLVLSDTLTLYSCNERTPSHPIKHYGLFTMEDGEPVPDTFRHEQYLSIREGGKTILISGCSHKGILNIMEWLHPDVLVGGFHFKELHPVQDADPLIRAARVLSHYPCQYYTCHCTGVEQYAVLKARMGEKLHYLGCGQQLVI